MKPCNLLLDLREYRCGLIQTVEQYRFAYLAILTGFRILFPELFKEKEIHVETGEIDITKKGESFLLVKISN